ncbi:O-antigen ligase family protein [Pigmentiphaga litoralis]|uniref:O-antigen ligase family protein n=1 Tax=Pigmentiphaga litoralis TaxID=516702 RepID=UPI003B42D453
MTLSLLASRYLLTLLTCLALAVGPFLHIPWTIDASYHNNQRLMQVLVLVIAAVTVLARQHRHGGALAWPGNAGAAWLGLWLLLGIVSGTQALSPRHAFYEWGSLTLLIVLALAIAAEWTRDADGGQIAARMRRMALWCGYGCVAYMFLAMAYYLITVIGRVQPSQLILSPGYDNHRFLNHVQTISLPFLAWLALPAAGVADHPAHRAMWWRMTAAWWMLLFVTGGRGTVFGIGVAVVVVLVLYGRQAWPWTRVLLTSAVAGIVAYLLLYVAVPLALGLKPFGVLQGVAERSLVDPASGRLDLWRLSWSMIQSHPWLGEGPLHFAHRAMALKANAHPHDWLLQIAAEWGVPAVVALTAALVCGVMAIWRRGRAVAPDDVAGQALRATLMGGVAATIADAFVSGSMVMPMSQLWIVVLIACGVAWTKRMPAAPGARPDGAAGRVQRKVWTSLFMALVLAFAVASVLRAMLPEALDLTAQERDFTPPAYPFFAPRMWRNGYF